ncbi:glycosyltransferase [Dyadobacter sp. Leaf189]|uniref:glycosyltransferase n=1 Tax=Dyadobacter sp. Leaf189 TaxID=1736295 RepID=UPI0006F87CEB|nr:glycosyltransferase [Dyadobacter sp. Leaf189]KQS24768.1 hypothetical protein ASG33_23740 [Dyadobacter sp. Leaf189]
MIGRLTVSKGIREYYEAVKIVRSKYPEVKCCLAGEYEVQNIDCIDNELYGNLVMGNVVTYLGFRKDTASLIGNSSVVVLPSYREGTPRALLEALAVGRAVITTDTPGCREVINPDLHHRNGFLIAPGNTQNLALCMENIISNPTIIAEMGANGRKYAEEKFDVRNVNKEMLATLEL